MYNRQGAHQPAQGPRRAAVVPHVPPYHQIPPYQPYRHTSTQAGSFSSHDGTYRASSQHESAVIHQQPQIPSAPMGGYHANQLPASFDVNKYLPHRFNPLRDPPSGVPSYEVPVYQGMPGTQMRYHAQPPNSFVPVHHQYHYAHQRAPHHGFQPPPPPIHQTQYARQPYHRPHAFSTPQQTPPVKRKRFEFYCDSCSKGFECEEDFDIHVAEDHVTCSHPGCGFSAREEVVRAHKLKHAVNMDSPEEIEAWLAMRRNKFPRKTAPADQPKDAPPLPLSKLEKFIRNSMRQSAIEARKKRREREQKQPCVHWERAGRCLYGDKCSFAHEKSGICTFFLNHGRCRHGDGCKYKHVRTGSRELEEIRDPRGNLLKKLMSPEIHKFQSTMLQCIRHMVNNKFYQEEIVAEPETVIEPLFFDDDEDLSDEEYDDSVLLSPISNS